MTTFTATKVRTRRTYARKTTATPKIWWNPKESELIQALQKQLIPALYGVEHAKAALDIPGFKLAERAVATHYGTDLEPEGNEGYDVMTSDGCAEVRCRSFRERKNGQGYTYIGTTVLSEKDSEKKRRGGCEILIVCCWDPIDETLVWFRIPASVVFRTKAFNIQRGKEGGYGKFTQYVWEGGPQV